MKGLRHSFRTAIQSGPDVGGPICIAVPNAHLWTINKLMRHHTTDRTLDYNSSASAL